MARLRRILFGPGRSEAGPARRVGFSTSEAWTIIRVGDWVWRDSTLLCVCSVRSGIICARDSARCETETTGRIEFMPGDLVDISTNEAPLIVDTATVTEEGLYALDPVEYAMLEGVVRDLESRGGTVAPTPLHQIIPHGSQFRSDVQ